MMNITELTNKLKEREIPRLWYSINGYSEEAFCIEKTPESKWIVYYGERGNKDRMKTFLNEDEACAELWSKMLKKLARAEKRKLNSKK